jgi:hypothetical protein
MYGHMHACVSVGWSLRTTDSCKIHIFSKETTLYTEYVEGMMLGVQHLSQLGSRRCPARAWYRLGLEGRRIEAFGVADLSHDPDQLGNTLGTFLSNACLLS